MSKFYCKAFSNTVLALSLFLLIFSINTKNAFAGDFVHGHSGGCYSTTTARCDNHHIRTTHGTNYYHCQRCLIHQTFNETVYWDVCDNGLVPDSDCGYVQTCSVCGYVRCNDNPSPGSHNYTTTYVACGYGAGEKLASVSLSPSTTSWTNGAVTLSADVSVANSRFSLSGSPFDFGGGYSGSSSMEATDNGSYSVTVKAADGTTASASYTVSNIDKTSPSLSLSKSTEAWTEDGLTISASGSDGESGVAGYSFDGSNFGGETSMKVTKNGTYSVSVKDNAGNVTTESITISNIGRDPEVVRAEKEAAEKAAAEKAAAEKAAAEKAAAEKAAAEKAAAEKAAAEKAAAEKAAAEKAAAEKAAADKAAGDKTTNKTGTSTGTGASTVTGTNQGDKTANKTGSTLAGLLGIGSKKDKVTEGSLGEKSDSSKNAASDKNGAIDVSGNVLTVNGGSAGGINGLVSVNNGKNPSNLMGGSDKNGSELYDNTADGDASDGQVMAGEELAISKLEGKRGFAALSREERAMWYVRVGSVLLLIGLGWFSTFSYVYMIEKGKIKPVSIINVKKENNRLILEISEKKLSKHGRYMIYYSPWLRLTKKDKPVYIMLKERENVLNTDNGMSFAY